MNFQKRLADRIQKQLSGCWLWTGKKGTRGYGQIRIGARRRQAHIAVYEALVGPVPKGLELDHKCRVHECVNPDHLEPVTHAENMRRGLQTAQRLQAEKVACAKGHPFDVENTRNTKWGRVCRTCDRERRRIARAATA